MRRNYLLYQVFLFSCSSNHNTRRLSSISLHWKVIFINKKKKRQKLLTFGHVETRCSNISHVHIEDASRAEMEQ